MSDTAPQPSVYPHLHLHTEYSIIDGAIRIGDLIKKVKGLGHQAVAITDLTNMFGTVEFYAKAKDSGVKPILGAELLHKPTVSTAAAAGPFAILLYARSNEGYKNLMRNTSFGYLDNTPGDVPIVNPRRMEELASHLLAISVCGRGEFSQLVRAIAAIQPRLDEALVSPHADAAPLVASLQEHVAFMRRLYGADGFYVEIADNQLPEQKRLIPQLMVAARHYQVPVVATANALYLNEEDQEAHTILTCIKNDLTISKIRQRRKNTRFHVLSNEEMAEVYGAWPEALANIQTIVDQCNVSLEFGKYFLPRFELSDGENENDALRRLSRKGLDERFATLRPVYGPSFDDAAQEKYRQRLEFELDVIISMGFPGYFLIVQDFINWAKDNDIPVGPGRGSGAGSLVAYALRITDLDPIPFNLIFERFLNPERVSMPDFDVDFCQDRRDEVIRYVTRKYNPENVAQITTFGKMKAKAALRDVGRALEIGYGKVDRIAKLIPNELEITLKQAFEKEPRIMEEAGKDPSLEEMIKIALQLEGLCRHTSVHAAGVVISEGGMENYVPVYKDPNNTLITQYEMKNAEKVGLVKFDFLGLKTLTVIQKTVKLVHKGGKTSFRIDAIDLEDRKVYDLISTAQSTGIFQLESSGMQSLVSKLKPSRFEDLVAIVALFRPGPLGSGMVDDFIERKHGRQDISYPLPQLEPILNDTYGIILYQEQVQKIAAVLANYSLGEADLLRRAMGKKKPEEMAKQKSRFIQGARENAIDEKIADDIFELMAKFAAYGFNKSHSAAYGLVSYHTAYLKTYFPEEFMAAIMTCDLDNTDKLVRYIQECRRLGFTLLPPDINRSELAFDVPKRRTVGFGLAAIKGIGAGSLETILQERQNNGPFKSLTDLAKRVKLARVGKKTMELLIQAGALDGFSKNRTYLMRIAGDMVKYSETVHSAKSSGTRMLFDSDEGDDAGQDATVEWESVKAKDVEPNLLDDMFKEKKLLGAFLSQHPMQFFANDQKRFGQFRIADIPGKIGQKNVPIVCLLNGTSERITKTNKRMAYIDMEDETGTWEGVMFENELPPKFPEAPAFIVAYVPVSKSFHDQSLSVRVEKIVPLAELRTELVKQATLELQVKRQGGSEDLARIKKMLGTLRGVLDQHPGVTRVKLVLNYAEAKVKIDAGHMTVALNDELIKGVARYRSQGTTLLYQ